MQELDVPYEIVISDDCSTDNTPKIIQEYAKKDARIRIVSRPANVGMLKNWLEAINACNGSFVALCEGDDYWTDHKKLNKQLQLLQHAPSVSCCFTDASLIAEKDVHLRFDSYLQENDVALEKTTYTLTDLGKSNFIPTCTVMFRKNETIVLPESYFQSPYADWFFHIYNALRGDYRLISEQTAAYRLHNQGVFGQIKQAQRDNIKLKCLAALYQGFKHEVKAKNALKPTVAQSLRQKATNARHQSKRYSFLWLTFLRIAYQRTGFTTFAKWAVSI